MKIDSVRYIQRLKDTSYVLMDCSELVFKKEVTRTEYTLDTTISDKIFLNQFYHFLEYTELDSVHPPVNALTKLRVYFQDSSLDICIGHFRKAKIHEVPVALPDSMFDLLNQYN